MKQPPRGRLITPDPRLTAEYLSLAASIDTCEVITVDGDRYTCPSTDEHSDHVRHHDGTTNDVIACPRCIPAAGTRALHGAPNRSSTVLAERLKAIADELADIYRELVKDES